MNDKLKTDWMINALLGVIAVLLIGNYIGNSSSKFAQAAPGAGDGGGWGTNGVMISSTLPNERLVMVDTINQTILIYRQRPNSGLGLSGVRSYKYDIEAEDTVNKLAGNGWTFFDAKASYDANHK